MEQEMILKLQNIRKNFGGIQALKDVSLSLKKGEVHALLGENGAGKSTLIKILTGVHKADSGEILLHGREITVQNPIDARKKGIAAIYQELSLIDSLTVAENIFLGNEPTKMIAGVCDKTKLYKASDEYLEEFHIQIDSRKKISELGMGQKRIIEIIKALAINAEILLLDEPTTGMSKAEIEVLFQIMNTLKEKKVTMIYISHYLDEVFQVCDRATVFRDGKNVDTYDVGKVSVDILIKAMIGKEVAVRKAREEKQFTDQKILLELKNYKTDIMSYPIDLQLRQSEIIGITGIVGAGKSEIAHSIFGNARREMGEMFCGGKKVKLHNPSDTKKYNMAFIPEDRKSQGLFLEQKISDNIVLAGLEKIQSSLKLLSQKKKNCLAKATGEKLKIQPLKVELKVKNLSGGNQQKVVLGKWLLNDPEIILMDEPTRGIDIGAKEEIYSIITAMAEQGKGILIFSSEFEELISLCDSIYVLYKGKIVGKVDAKDATSEKLLSLALGGTVNG